MCGVSTRRVDQLVESLGLRVSRRRCRGSPPSSTSRSRRSAAARWRATTPTCGSTRRSSRSATAAGSSAKAVVIAYGVHETGRREILGFDVGEAETEAFWREFLKSLLARGLGGVQLVVSDAHEGLKAAIARQLRCPWQRCTRPLPARLPRPRPPRPARPVGRADPADLPGRLGRAGPPAALRGDRRARAAAAEGRRARSVISTHHHGRRASAAPPRRRRRRSRSPSRCRRGCHSAPPAHSRVSSDRRGGSIC